MTRDDTPITESELRWSYRRARLEDRGIDFDQAMATPCLRACLELGAAMRRRRRARLDASNTGAGIERSAPDFSTAAP